MSETKTKTETEKEEGKGHQTKKANLDDTYIGPNTSHDDDPRQRGPRRRG